MIGASISLDASVLPDTGTIASAPQALDVSMTAPGSLFTAQNGASIEVTVSGTSTYDGTYTFAAAALDSGPVNLVPPVLSGDGSPEVGETLSVTPGLWVYDSAGGLPVIVHTSDGFGMMDGLDYAIVAADDARTITVLEDATNTRGSRTQPSNGIAIAQPAPFGLVMTDNGEVEIVTSGSTVSVSISDSSAYDGTYTFAAAALDSGPVNLVPPVLNTDGSPEVGQTLSVSPGLWVYDGDNTAPLVTTTVSGAGPLTDLSYDILPADAGTTLTATEELIGDNGTRTALSNDVTVEAVEAVAGKPTTLTQIDFANATAADGTLVTAPATLGLDLVPHAGNTALVGQAAVFAGTSVLKGQSLMPAGTSHPLPATSYNVTNTGLDRITSGLYAGAWLVGNDGRDTVDVPGVRSQGLFILSADFSTALANLDVGAAGSVQGVAFDPSDDTFWFCDYDSFAVRRCDQTGAVLQSLTMSYRPNGLAYIAETDELIVTELGTTNRHVYAAGTGAFVRTFAGAGAGAHDMLHWSSKFGLLFETDGQNGNQGQIFYYPLDVTSSAQRTTGAYHSLDISATTTLAIEGLYIDGTTGHVFISDDSYSHGVGSGTNQILEIDATSKLSVPLDSQTLHIHMTGDLGPHTGDTDLMVGSLGRVATADEQSWGFYRIGGGGFRFFSGLNAGGDFFYVDWPAVTAQVSEVDLSVDLTAGTLVLNVDGTEQSGQSYGNSTTAATWDHSFRMDDIALGGTIRFSNGLAERQIANMSVRTLTIDTETL